MAPLPVIPNVVRVDFRWNAFGGVRPHNTLHMLTATDNLEQIAADIGSAWDVGTFNPFTLLDNSYFVDEVDLTPLDGTTARQTHPLGVTISGSSDGQLIPSMAAVVSLRTNRRGPRGRGRMFVGPINESGQDGGLLNASARADMIAGWTGFVDALADTSSNLSLCVASYTHSEAYGVTSIQIASAAGTMRKRQDQLK